MDRTSGDVIRLTWPILPKFDSPLKCKVSQVDVRFVATLVLQSKFGISGEVKDIRGPVVSCPKFMQVGISERPGVETVRHMTESEVERVRQGNAFLIYQVGLESESLHVVGELTLDAETGKPLFSKFWQR